MNDLNNVDAGWAWAPVHENKTVEWNRKAAAHLFRRAGFAASSAELDSAVQKTPQNVVHEIVQERTETNDFTSESQSLGDLVLATANVKNLPAWWTYRLLNTSHPLKEKMTLFWHGHFATSGAKVTEAKLMFQQNHLLRSHALGNFGKLLHEISRDPAMLIYLDSATNRKSHPNENYAREIMELFCLGEGNYSEKDIRELARCFTGWEIRRGKFRFNKYQHDNGRKSILGETGEFDGYDGVDIVLGQPSGPDFIACKLMRFFLFNEPTPPRHLVSPIANLIRKNDWDIAPATETILASNLFFSNYCRGQTVKSPVEFATGFLTSLEGTTDLYGLSNGLADLGQVLFFPPNVKGWDGGRAWINSSTLLARTNLIRKLLDRKETRFAGGGLADLFDKHRLRTASEIVDWLEETMFALPVPDSVRQKVVQQFDTGAGSREKRLRDGLHLLCTLPEFQLG